MLPFEFLKFIFWHFCAPEAKCRLVILEWGEGRRLSPKHCNLRPNSLDGEYMWLILVLTLPSWVFGVGRSKWKYVLWPSIGRPHLKIQNILINGTTAELAPDRCQLLRFFHHSPHDHASSALLGRGVTYSFKSLSLSMRRQAHVVWGCTASWSHCISSVFIQLGQTTTNWDLEPYLTRHAAAHARSMQWRSPFGVFVCKSVQYKTSMVNVLLKPSLQHNVCSWHICIKMLFSFHTVWMCCQTKAWGRMCLFLIHLRIWKLYCGVSGASLTAWRFWMNSGL